MTKLQKILTRLYGYNIDEAEREILDWHNSELTVAKAHQEIETYCAVKKKYKSKQLTEREIEIIVAETHYDLPKQNFLSIKAKALEGKHFGDCTNEPEPCAVCQYEEIKDLAHSIKEAMNK